ncbi:RlpA-like double-psi beta-barrel-protein domain-containing protein-containing protein, partial [Cyathus striatus]
ATNYYTGLGNCGAWSQDSDFIVALSTAEYNNGAHCWQHIQVHYQGKTIDATVVDSCPGCSQYSIDLSPAAFSALAPLDAGRIQVDWNYV